MQTKFINQGTTEDRSKHTEITGVHVQRLQVYTDKLTYDQRRLVTLLHARCCANHAIHGRFNPLSQQIRYTYWRHQECPLWPARDCHDRVVIPLHAQALHSQNTATPTLLHSQDTATWRQATPAHSGAQLWLINSKMVVLTIDLIDSVYVVY